MSIKSKCLWFMSGILLISGLVVAEEKVNLKSNFQVHAVFEVEKFKGEEKPFAELTDQAVSIIDARLKAIGIKAELRKEGDNRIVADLKEVQDPERTLNIIEKPYYLEFKLVENNPTLLEKAVSGSVPENYQLLYEWEKDPKGVLKPSTPYLVFAQPVLTGSDIEDARQGRNLPLLRPPRAVGETDGAQDVEQSSSLGSLPVIDIKFKPAGAQKFAEFTEINIGKRLAIVLDGVIQSAPVIRDRIPSGRAQISGRFTEQEAGDLVLALRTGGLPVNLRLISKEVKKVNVALDATASAATPTEVRSPSPRRYAKIVLNEDKTKVLSVMFVESKGTGTGYNLLYADVNLNGTFEENERFEGNAEKAPFPYYTFPVINLNIPYNEKGTGITNPCKIFFVYLKPPDSEMFPFQETVKLHQGSSTWEYLFMAGINPSDSPAGVSLVDLVKTPEFKISTVPDLQKKGNTGIGLSLMAGDVLVQCKRDNTSPNARIEIKAKDGKLVHQDTAGMDKFTFT